MIPYSQSNWFRRHESSVNNKLHPLEQTEWRLDVYGVMQLGLFARSSSIFAVGTSNYISYLKKKKAYKSIDRVKFTLFNEMPCKAISHGFNCPIFISFNMFIFSFFSFSPAILHAVNVSLHLARAARSFHACLFYTKGKQKAVIRCI